MSPTEMSNEQLRMEYERISPLILPYFPIFREYHQRELLNKIIPASSTDTHIIKNQFNYLNTLQNLLENY